MINPAALTAQYSAAGQNCYNVSYTQFDGKTEKRDLDGNLPTLVERFGGELERIPESMNVCNAGTFAGVQYYNQFWRDQQHPGASDYLDAEFSFQVGPGGQFLCDFIELLTDALAVVEPEFAVEDVELGEELQAICQETEDAVNGLSGRSVEKWKNDTLVRDYPTDPHDDFEFTLAPSKRGLKKRMVSTGVDALVKDLYDAAPPGNKVGAGAPPGVFTLDPATSAVYTTAEYYGCTAVILFSGKKVLIAHFTEDQFRPGNDNAFDAGVIEPLESVMLANEVDLGQNLLTAIFSPWRIVPLDGIGDYSFAYKSRLTGDGSITASITSDFPNAAVTELIGYRKLFSADPDFDELSTGKIVVEWKAPNDAACADSAGVGTINLYAESSWYLQVHVDDQGNVVNVVGSSSGSSPCSLAADDAIDDGNGASWSK